VGAAAQARADVTSRFCSQQDDNQFEGKLQERGHVQGKFIKEPIQDFSYGMSP